MKILQIFLVSILLLTACKKQVTEEYVPVTDGARSHKATILEVKPAGGYTYLYVQENGEKFWMAVNKGGLKVGDEFVYSNALVMKNFKSEELDKVFEEILFVDASQGAMSSNVPKDEMHQNMPNDEVHKAAPDSIRQSKNRMSKADQENIQVEKAKGGVTIGELYENQNQYKDQEVLVRGKVVKINPSIMDRNWVHLKDGTEFEGKRDLTFTTQEEVSVGDVVTFKGTVAIDKDFGAGYVYPLIVEKGIIQQE